MGAICHTEKVERVRRTTKKVIRGLAHVLPFRRVPTLIARRLMEVVARNLNYFPAKNGISDSLSQLSTVVEVPLSGTRSHLLDFGARSKIFEDNSWFQNLNKIRFMPTINLGQSLHRKSRKTLMSLKAEKSFCRKK